MREDSIANSPIEVKIRESYNSLTQGFRKIADFILEHPVNAAHLPQAEIAHRIDIYPVTISYFAQYLGYPDYKILASQLQRDINHRRMIAHYKALEENEPLVQKLYKCNQEKLSNFLQGKHDDLKKALSALQEASHIWVTGEFICYSLAQFFSQVLTLVEIPTTAFQPGMMETTTNLQKMKAGDALLAFALGIPSFDTAHLIQLAGQQEVTTIVLTDSQEAPPAQVAKITLNIESDSPLLTPNYTVGLSVMSLMLETMIGENLEQFLDSLTKHQKCHGEIMNLRTNTLENGSPLT
ncbi:MAG: SIS domain-containing protein [Chloroflexi bacterium]|jgi:DNA-binding MurR/RpiR family transcriptional regulator|nr:SIS domain-containing protein [Chloroflexota bacterium]